MASLAQESRGLMAADGGPHEDGQLVTLRRPLPLAERRGRQLRALGAAAMGLLAVAAIGGAAWHPASSGAPRTAVAVRGERGTTIRGVEELELVRAPGKPQLLGALNIPLPHVVLNATADVQELCDSVKDQVPTLLGISGWQIVLEPYKAVSYCTDGLGYTVKVEAEAGKHLEGHPEPAYLQLSIRNDTRPTLFTAIMVESIEGLCASLPVLPPSARPERLTEPPSPVVAEGALADQGTNASAEKGDDAAPLVVEQGRNSSAARDGEAAPLTSKQEVATKRGTNSSARKGEDAVSATTAEAATAKQGTNSSSERGENGHRAVPLIVAEGASAKQGTNLSAAEGAEAALTTSAKEGGPAGQGANSSAKKCDDVAC